MFMLVFLYMTVAVVELDIPKYKIIKFDEVEYLATAVIIPTIEGLIRLFILLLFNNISILVIYKYILL